MAFTHAIKLNNCLPSTLLKGRTPISSWQSEVFDPRRFPLEPYCTYVAAHIPLETHTNGSGRSVLDYYVGFSEHHRGGILVCDPKTRTTTIRHTYKALGLVEEQLLLIIDTDSPVTMTAAQTEQTQLLAAPIPPLATRSTASTLSTSAAGAGIVPDSSILPRGLLTAPSLSSVRTPSTPNLSPDTLPASDRFILDEIICHVQTTHPSPPAQPDLSQPIVRDGTHYKRISPRTCSKSVKPFLRYVDHDFRDTSARTQFRITGVYLATPNDTTLEPTYWFRFYDRPQPPTSIDDYEHEPCHQVLADTTYVFTAFVPAAQCRANKVRAVSTRGVSDKAMSFGQVMAHTEAQGLKAAPIDELKSLSPSQHNTWVEFSGNKKDVPKGRLISSKAIFSVVYNPDGTFKKCKARLVARVDMLQSKSKDTYSGAVSSQATRLLLGIIAEPDLDLRSFDVKLAFLYTRLNEFSEGIYMRRPKV